MVVISLLVLSPRLSAQEPVSDSAALLDTVLVKAFEQNRREERSATSVKVIEFNNGDRYTKTSLVNGFNTVAGVRMEERSPGSYRINIRGSSLRSPFGVRNVKVYWDGIPITDAGGNTYFNQFAWNNFSNIEIFKGPAGSLYGAGTGGLILLNTLERWQPGTSLEYITGSYGLQNIFASARFGKKENKNQVTYAHNESDGYRTQTALRRDNLSWESQLKLTERQQLNAYLLYTDMYYQTPGALTLAEFRANPRAARPAGGGFPSAVAAKAAIFQKTVTTGFTSKYTITSEFSNTTTLYGSFAQIKNPAIRNYERRNEPGYGGRTFFTFKHPWRRAGTGYNTLQVLAGGEFQQGLFNTQVSKNKNGQPDTLQTNDDIRYTTYSFFLQGDMNWNDSWLLNAGISINRSDVRFKRLSVYPVITQGRKYKNELAPRFSVRKNFDHGFSFKGTVSRGFSPPTIAELLPSTGVISTNLEAEYGWNYETTLRKEWLNGRLNLEATGFYFRLQQALVQRRDLSGADYFVNAGDIRQKGLELTANFTQVTHKGPVDYYSINVAGSLNRFRYGSFQKGADDFSGKVVPSVPSSTWSVLIDVQFKCGFYSNITGYSASKIYLNDANTASADAYQLLGWRLGWSRSFHARHKLNLYAGADNLLDEKYSLGNDINAAANRFYNAAPGRNYYGGVSWQWISRKKG